MHEYNIFSKPDHIIWKEKVQREMLHIWLTPVVASVAGILLSLVAIWLTP